MTGVLTGLIVFCLVLLALMALAKPLRILGRFLLSALVGAGGLWLCSWIGLGVGVNLVTVLTCGTLGVSGFLGIVVLSILL